MHAHMLRMCGTLLCCLLSVTAWALSGPETAVQLNQRLQATPARCAANWPVEACSGVLMRPMAEEHLVNFWLHDAEATGRGSERFDYLRVDIGLTPQEQRTGYVLMSGFDAQGGVKPYALQARPNPGERLVVNWDPAQPEKLAIEALYYTLGKPKALLRAQRGQLAWFKATGQWLPVLRFAPGQSAAFGFDNSEQLYNGYAVASRITGRYGDTAASCPDGSAAFNCNGVLLRTTDVGNFHAWDPSPGSIKGNGVSFSYLRADTRVTTTYKRQGFIVRPLSYPVIQPLTLRCAYPYDAHTGGQSDMCGFRPSCASLGVTSVQAWKARYQGNTPSSCHFTTSPTEFQLNNDIRGAGGATPDYGWNELMMAAWAPGNGAGLPLEAFIYSTVGNVPGQGLQGAQTFQMDFYQTTGRHLPILRVQPGAPTTQVFTYLPEEQKTE